MTGFGAGDTWERRTWEVIIHLLNKYMIGLYRVLELYLMSGYKRCTRRMLPPGNLIHSNGKPAKGMHYESEFSLSRRTRAQLSDQNSPFRW